MIGDQKAMEIETTKGRILWGILGGLVAGFTKYLGQDHHLFRIYMETNAMDKLAGMAASYAILLMILCFVGAVIASATQERNKFKLLAIAVAAPAIITTYLGGGGVGAPAKIQLSDFSPVSVAMAADTRTSPSWRQGFWEGFAATFGIGKDRSLYRVVVASYKDKTAADMAALRFNKQFPELKFSVAERRGENEFFPVIAGEWQYFPDAVKLRDALAEKTGAKDMFLFPYSP